MTYKENITAILECHFAGFKEEIIDSACNRILEQEPCEDAIRRQAVLDLAKKGVLVSNGNYESVCKAINEIPSVNLMPCEDSISRQAVLDAIDVKAWEFCDYLISKNRNDEQKPVSHFADNLRECVREELPPVNPQPKTGHWESTELFYEGESRGSIIKCSECGNEFKVSPKVFERLYDNERFCNHCGCRMIEPQERSDKE